MAGWDVNGMSCLVTGGASGLGAAYVKGLLNAGAKQIAILDIAEDIGKEFTEELNKTYPGKAIFVKCDVGDERCIAAAFDEIVSKFKTLDVLVNNAGIMNDAPSIWWKMCDVNVQGLISFTLKGIKHMRKDEGGAGGTIINISSIAALTKNDLMPIYFGTKIAVLHFSQCIAFGLYAQTGVRIMTLCPGSTDTPLIQQLKTKGRDASAGEKLEDFMKQGIMIPQTIDSATTALLKMYKEGNNGSCWITADNKPAKDFTPYLEDAFKRFEEACYS